MGEGSAERNVRGREMIEGRKLDWTVINYVIYLDLSVLRDKG